MQVTWSTPDPRGPGGPLERPTTTASRSSSGSDDSSRERIEKRYSGPKLIIDIGWFYYRFVYFHS